MTSGQFLRFLLSGGNNPASCGCLRQNSSAPHITFEITVVESPLYILIYLADFKRFEFTIHETGDEYVQKIHAQTRAIRRKSFRHVHTSSINISLFKYHINLMVPSNST